MFSHSSPAELKLVGIEGHSAESLRQEVERGARFVIYAYNLSFLVISIKRPTSIYFIRPGQNRIVRGLPFTLISLVFGWWGFPWGIIYTFQSLHTNLSGGTDVTDSILPALAPAASKQSSSAPPSPPRPPAPFNWRPVGWIAAGIVSVAALVFGLVSYQQEQKLPVAFVSGLSENYEVSVNGQRHVVRSARPQIVELPEGELKVTTTFPNGLKEEQSFTFERGFWSRPFSPRIAIINPDRTAIVYEQTTFYHPTGTTATDATPDPVLHVGQASYFLPKPDYVFDDFPESLQMPSGTSRLQKTRLGQLSDIAPSSAADFIGRNLGYDHARRYIDALASHNPNDEGMLRAAFQTLKPADGETFFQRHLSQRPLLIEWHRYYQEFAQHYLPHTDLIGQYRGLCTAEPQNGDLLYLLGRVLPSPLEARELYQRAVAAPQPSIYAFNALGFEELNVGHFDRALEYLEQAEKRGLKSTSLQYSKRATLLGLRRYEPLLEEARATRNRNPRDIQNVEAEIHLSLAAGLDVAVAEKLKSDYLARPEIRTARVTERQVAEHRLAAAIAHGRGQHDEYVAHQAKIPAPEGNFNLAIMQGDVAAAGKILANVSRQSSSAWLLTYLAAARTGNSPEAETAFQKALAALATEDDSQKQIAAALTGEKPLSPEEICALPMYPAEKRVIAAALGVHEPAHQQVYFRTARLMNLEPDFPQLFLSEILR